MTYAELSSIAHAARHELDTLLAKCESLERTVEHLKRVNEEQAREWSAEVRRLKGLLAKKRGHSGPRKKYYLLTFAAGTKITYTADEPTPSDYPGALSSWGPFRTKRAAEWAQVYGQNNPHAVTVAQVEKLARSVWSPDDCRLD